MTKPSRRNFLSGTAAGAAAFTIMSPQTALSYQANSKVSVGLIGSGNRGSYDASIVHADPRGRITALCDLFDDRIEKAKQTIKVENPTVYKDFEKLLASPDIDAVVIATPPFEHPRMLEAAVQAKKHVYCEKPAGRRRRRRAARHRRRQEVRSQEESQLRFPAALRPGLPGSVQAHAGRRHRRTGQCARLLDRRRSLQAHALPRSENRAPAQLVLLPRYSGDFIVEQDCHNFDVLHWFLNARPISAVGRGGRKVRTNMEILDHLNLTYTFPDNIIVNFEANQMSPPGFSHVGEQFTGTKGVLDTSRARLVHTKGPRNVETIESKRDITNDAIEAFLQRILDGEVENVAERSAISTCSRSSAARRSTIIAKPPGRASSEVSAHDARLVRGSDADRHAPTLSRSG